jgi:DNA-binding GntR family transcriptional regulator
LSDDEVALLLQRRTWTDNLVASFADLYYPGNRYRLRDRFDPKKVGLR